MKTWRIVVVILVIAALPSLASAKDLAQRISVGYNQQASVGWVGSQNDTLTNQFLSSSAISSKYWFDNLWAIEGIFGYYTAKNEDVGGWASEIAAKLHYVLNDEDNLKFYGGGGLGIIPMKIDYGRDEKNYTGFLVMGFVGWEFFFQGLPNLGFDVEVGLQYIDIDTYAQLNTYGGGFGSLGIRYYF